MPYITGTRTTHPSTVLRGERDRLRRRDFSGRLWHFSAPIAPAPKADPFKCLIRQVHRFARTPTKQFFAERFNITEHDLETYLSEALSAGGDYADVYIEYLAASPLGIDEQIVKSATEGVSMGAGVRVIAGERTGYAYSDDLSPAKIRKAAHTAALIAKGPASVVKTGFEESQQHNLYPMLHAPNEMGLDERVALIKRADEAARA